MKNIKKYITAFMTAIISLSISISVSAAPQINMIYDFHIREKDSSWLASSGNIDIREVDGNSVIKQTAGQTIALKFPKAQTSGSIHYSFKYKKTGSGNAYAGIYNTVESDQMTSIDLTSWAERSKFICYSLTDRLSLYASSLNANDFTSYEMDSNRYFIQGDWNKVDVIITGIGTPNMIADIFLNGNSLFGDDKWNYSSSKGVKGLWWYDETGATYIDDVSVRTYSDTPSIGMYALYDRFDTTDGSVEMTLSEEVTDSSQIISDNITVVDVDTGYEIEDFVVDNVTSTSFRLSFNGTVPRGTYRVTLTGVEGKSTGVTTVDSAEIRTDYEYIYIDNNYANLNFNGYTGGLQVTSEKSFSNYQSGFLTDTEASYGEGDEGQEDVAFKVENVRTKRATNPPFPLGARSYLYALDNITTGGEDLTVSFKVKYSENIDWYVKLFDNGETENSTVDTTNSIVGVEGGAVKYGKAKNNFVSLSGATVPLDTWTNVKLELSPVSSNNTAVRLTIGNNSYSFVTERNFYTTSLGSIGISYKPTNDDNINYLSFDDIIVSGKSKALYPEIDTINVYDYENNLQKGKELTSATSRLELVFNTLVNHESVYDGLEINVSDNFNIDIDDVDGKTIVDIEFPKLLTPSSKNNKNIITIELSDSIIAEGVVDAEGNNLGLLPYSSKYEVLTDATFILYDEDEITTDSTKYSLKALKTDDEAYNFISVIAGYKSKTIGNKVYKELARIYYVPVEFAENERGAKSFPETPINIQFSDCDCVEVTKMNLPAMSIFE